MPKFSIETIEIRRYWNYIFKVLKGKECQQRILQELYVKITSPRYLAEEEALNAPSPHRHTASTIHGSITFVRNPATSWEAPEPWGHRKPATLKPVGKFATPTLHNPHLQHSGIWLRENPQFPTSPLGETEGCVYECSTSSGCCLRDMPLSCLSQSTDWTRYILDAQGPLQINIVVWSSTRALAMASPPGQEQSKLVKNTSFQLFPEEGKNCTSHPMSQLYWLIHKRIAYLGVRTGPVIV